MSFLAFYSNLNFFFFLGFCPFLFSLYRRDNPFQGPKGGLSLVPLITFSFCFFCVDNF